MAKRRKNGKIQAAAALQGVSDRSIRNWLKELPEPYPIDGTEEEQRAWRGRHHPKDGAPKAISETARLRRFQADREEIELRQLRGELVEVEAVDLAHMKGFAVLRSGIRALPARVAGPVAAMTDEAEIQRYVGTECDRVLAEALEAFRSWIAGELRAARGADGAAAAADGGPVG